MNTTDRTEYLTRLALNGGFAELNRLSRHDLLTVLAARAELSALWLALAVRHACG